LNSAGNIHVQFFGESIDKDDEKTWNPDPDNLLKSPPDCFRQANDYWSTKFVYLTRRNFFLNDLIRFLPLFQCNDCLTYHVEPTNFTVVTPLTAMTQTSLRDFPTFKNEHKTTEKIIPGKFEKENDKNQIFPFPHSKLNCPNAQHVHVCQI
jgi:hypothetical protein